MLEKISIPTSENLPKKPTKDGKEKPKRNSL